MGERPRLRFRRMESLLRPTARQRRPGDGFGRRRELGPWRGDRTDRGDRRLRRPLAGAQARSQKAWRCAGCCAHGRVRRRLGRCDPRRRPRFHPRPDADPQLSGARPPAGKAGPAGHRTAGREPRADARILRLHRRRSGPSDLPGRRPGSSDRHDPRSAGDPEAHLLRHGRHPVHAHRRAGREILAAAAVRGRRQVRAERLLQGRQAGHPVQAGRGRRLRTLPAQALPRHQALWSGWRRGHGSGAGAGHQARRFAGRRRGRAGHGPPRPPERARRRDGQAL